jgi:anti-anti-sigma factor
MTGLDVTTTVTDGVAVLALEGELDLATVTILDAAIDRALAEAEPPRCIAVDQRELEFMDSSGLRTVVMADTRLRDQEVRFALIRGTEAVQRVFDITRMAERLDFVDDPGEL